MRSVSLLGPKQTFCDKALNKYEKFTDEKFKVFYCDSIIESAKKSKDTDLLILPFENSLDGFVTEALDILMSESLLIVAEIKQNIAFKLVSYENNINDIEKIYVQFKAKGQCLHFLEPYLSKCVLTESNLLSLDYLMENKNKSAAIVPMHINEEFPLVLKDITDSKNNETRFLVISRNKNDIFYSDLIKVSCYAYALLDKPGILYNILRRFDEYHINLSNIISRPTKSELGKYNFYIEFSLAKKDLSKVDLILNEFNNDTDYKLKILGIYSDIGDKK